VWQNLTGLYLQMHAPKLVFSSFPEMQVLWKFQSGSQPVVILSKLRKDIEGIMGKSLFGIALIYSSMIMTPILARMFKL
jgi:hypothetical protein